MFVVLVGNLGQVEWGGAVFLHVLHPSIAKQLWSHWGRLKLRHLAQGHHMLLYGVLTVVVLPE